MQKIRAFVVALGVLFAVNESLPAGAGESPWVDLAITGDAGLWNSMAKSVRDSVLRKGVTGLILPGDNLYPPLSQNSYDQAWLPWSGKGLTFDVVAIGNHNGGYAAERSYFKMPGEYFSVVRGAARFLVLNSDNERNAEDQAKWLEGELSTAREPLVFIVYHHPTYSVARMGHTWTEKRAFQLAIRPLLARFKSRITAVIVGHDHLAAVLTWDDTPVLLSGAVHEVRRDGPVDYRDVTGVRVKTQWYFDSTATWARLRIPRDAKEATEKGVRFDYIRAQDDRVGCSGTLVTGVALKLGPACDSGANFVRGADSEKR